MYHNLYQTSVLRNTSPTSRKLTFTQFALLLQSFIHLKLKRNLGMDISAIQLWKSFGANKIMTF